MKRKRSLGILLSMLMIIMTFSGSWTYALEESQVDSFVKVDRAQSRYQLPGDTDFVIIKQGSGKVLVWSEVILSTKQKSDIKAEAVSKDGSISSGTAFYYVNGYNGGVAFKAANAGIYDNNWGAYKFYKASGNLYVEVYAVRNGQIGSSDKGKISHLCYGKLKCGETAKGDIEITKAVTLDGNTTGKISGTFYISLFKNSNHTGRIDTKIVTVTNGRSSTVTFEDLEPAIYYVAETDAQGIAVKTGTSMGGYILNDVKGNDVSVKAESGKTSEKVITNDFTGAKGSITVNKNVIKDGNPYKVTDDFYVALFSDSKGSDKISDVRTIALKDAATAMVKFDGLEKEKDYYVFETDSSGNVIGNTEGKYTVSGQGTKVEFSEYDMDKTVDITNTLKVQEQISINLKGKKVLTGKDLSAGDFNFEVTEDGKEVATGTNDASGDISFSSIFYAEPGIHVYTVSEVVKGNKIPGVTYSEDKFTVIVKVSENREGKLEANVTYPKCGVCFVNKYDAKGSIALEAKKVLENTELKDKEFLFEVTDNRGNAVKDALGNPMITKNDAEGNVVFKDLAYSLKDAGKTFEYYISEVGYPSGSITFDKSRYKVNVNVSDENKDGVLKVTADYEKGSAPVFKNVYNAKGSFQLTAEKNLENMELKENLFGFKAQAVDEKGTPLAGNGKWDSIAYNDSKGNIQFDKIDYSIKDIGTHYYSIMEIEGSLGGVKYDKTEYTVKVKVWDKGNGVLGIETQYENGKATFTNKYEASGELELKAFKNLNDKVLEGDEFDFKAELTDEKGEAVTGEKAWSNTKSNATDGSVTFDKIKYTLDDAGKTYYYKITEIAKENGYMLYDDRQYMIKVNVIHKGDGKMETETEEINGPAVFTNTYTAQGDISLEGLKELTGRYMTAGEFTFEVIDEDNRIVAKGTNNEKGAISFTPIKYEASQTGIHKYTVKEDVGEDGDMKYDTHEEEVTVTVEDAGEGKLIATADKEASDIVFKNSYDPKGTVKVTKKVLVDGGAKGINASFSFALFTDPQCSKMYGDPVTVNMGGKSEAYGTFNKLPIGKYFVAELDKNGKALGQGKVSPESLGIGSEEVAVSYDDNKTVEITTNNSSAEAIVTNRISTEEEYYYEGKVKVKKIVTLDGEECNVKDIFYTALFADKNHTKRVSDVKALRIEGTSRASVTFTGLKEGTYYVTETNKDGSPLTEAQAKKSGFTSVVKSGGEENGIKTVIIENRLTKEKAANYVTGSTEMRSEDAVQTGDRKNMALWIALFVASAAIIAGVWISFRKRRKV